MLRRDHGSRRRPTPTGQGASARVVVSALAVAVLAVLLAPTSPVPQASAVAGDAVATSSTAPGTAATGTAATGVEVSSRTIERPRTPAVVDAEALGAQALARLRFEWAVSLPTWDVRFLPSRGAGDFGRTYRLERRIEIYVRADRDVDAIAHDVAHELGHAVDLEYLDDAARARYLRLRGLPRSTPWWTCNGCTDLQVGAGDFAETFALWAAPPYRFYSDLGDVPTATQLRRIAAQVVMPALQAAPAR